MSAADKAAENELLKKAIESGNPAMLDALLKQFNPPKIYPAMAGVMMDVKHVAKDQFNQMQKFNFRGIDDLYNAIHAALAKNGIFTTASVISRDVSERKTAKGGTMFVTVVRMAYTFHAVDGSSVTTESVGESADSGDKSTSKALSMTDKYALIQVFKVPTSDMPDADKESYQLAAKPRIEGGQVKTLSKKLIDYGIPPAKFADWLKTMKIDSIESVPADLFVIVDEKIEAINRNKQTQAQKAAA